MQVWDTCKNSFLECVAAVERVISPQVKLESFNLNKFTTPFVYSKINSETLKLNWSFLSSSFHEYMASSYIDG